MANELNARYNGSANIYAMVRRKSDAYVWNGTQFVAWDDSDISEYAIALTYQGGDLYAGTMPSGVPIGVHFLDYYIRAGASPSTLDIRINGSQIRWNGVEEAEGDDDSEEDEEVDPIDDAIANPRSVTSDGQTVEQHPLPDLIEADKYRRAQAAASRNKLGGIRLLKISPPPAD